MKAIARRSPWLFPDGVLFPVVSFEQHPLKRLARRLLVRGGALAVAFHLVVFGAWLVGRSTQATALPPPGGMRYVDPRNFSPPPSILPDREKPGLESIVTQPPEAAFGMPEPVPDFRVVDLPFGAPEDYTDQLPPADTNDSGGNGTIRILDDGQGSEGDPSPGQFIPVEEDPVPVVTPAPIYPEMARAAEVEGVVLLRVLVGRDGRVENAFVVDGQPMLNEAALAAVGKWTFRPALQQHKPVKVWVAIPIRFTLH